MHFKFTVWYCLCSRFFFKTYCEDIGNIMEEISDNSVQLPLFEGKIMGHVEKMDCFEA